MANDPLTEVARATLSALRVLLESTQLKLQEATQNLDEARNKLNRTMQLTVTEHGELEKVQLQRRNTLLRLEDLHKQEQERRATLATLEAAILSIPPDPPSNIGSSVSPTDTDMSDQATHEVVAQRTLQDERDPHVDDGCSDTNRNPKRDRSPGSSTESSPTKERNVAQKTNEMGEANEPPVKPKRGPPPKGKAGKIQPEPRSQLKYDRRIQTDGKIPIPLDARALRLIEQANTTVPAHRRNHYIKQQAEHVVECRGLGPCGCDISLYELFIRGGVFKQQVVIITILRNYLQKWEEHPETVTEKGKVVLRIPAEGPALWLCPSDQLCLPRYCLGQDAARSGTGHLPPEEACEDCVKANRICFLRRMPFENFRVVMLPLPRKHRMLRNDDGKDYECDDPDNLCYWVKDTAAFIEKYGKSENEG